MRIYEIAKEIGVSSATVVKWANERGIDATSPISKVSGADAEALRKAASGNSEISDLKSKREAKAARAAELSKTRSSADKEALAAHLSVAKDTAAKSVKPNAAKKSSAPVAAKPAVETAAKAPERAEAKSEPATAKNSAAPVSVKPTMAAKAPAARDNSRQNAPKASAEGEKKPFKLTPISINPHRPTIVRPKPTISISVKPLGAKNGGNAKPGDASKQNKFSNEPGQKGPRQKSAGFGGSHDGGYKAGQRPQAGQGQERNQALAGKTRPGYTPDFMDDERGSRRGKKDREGLKAFEKFAHKSSMQGEGQSSNSSGDNSSREIAIRGAIIVKDLAAKLNIKPNRLIADLMALKILASINQRVEPDIATKIADKYGYKVTIEHARSKDASARPVLKSIDADDLIPEDPPETLKPRAPVVTFLGHVDHGKTTLMDYIRKAHVAAGEAGGITQQISAYQVEIAGKKITFLDTPGHAAFSAMRARGASITDIAVLIIAADDGIMPQTEECIRVARKAGVQIMVAITKADKPTANIERVKQQLQKRGLTPEEWGGDIICCPVSGVTGEGVEALLENIIVQAEVLELMANPNRRANGYVIEAELQQGLGPCATLLVEGGTLKVGDAILIGEHFGKVRALIDDHGRRIKEAPPAMPVKCTGLSGVPEAGAEFRVMLDEKRARTLAAQTAQERKEQELANSKAATLDALMSRMAAEGKKELNVVVKSDTQGSLEAIVEALGQIKSEKVGLNIIGTGTGNVSLTDVKSAAAGRAIIVGFDIGNDSGVQQQARHDGVRINSFRIIYELIDHVKESMLDLLPPEYKEVVLGHAEIKAIYDIGKLGKIAGSQMLDGKLVAKEKYRILRNNSRIWDGKVQTLRHFKDEVKEVTGQQECGVCFVNYEQFKEGDIIECYQLEELPRSL